MSREPGKTTVIQLRNIAVTVCFITILTPAPAQTAEPELVAANKDLQAIFKRMKEKYAAHDAQQAQLAAQAQAAKIGPDITAPSQTFDAAIPSTAIPNTSDALYPSPSENDSRFTAGEELILSLSINNLELTSIFALKTTTGLQIGLGDFFQIAELPIYIDMESISADGWFKKENNHFSLKRLNDERLQVEANGKTYFISVKDYVVEDDIFIELDELKRWFNLDYKLNEEQLSLAISTKDKFPVELRLARLNKQGITKTAAIESVLPLKESGYKVFSPPMLDIQTSIQETNRVSPPPSSAPVGTKPTSTRTTSGSYSILASHDLAYLNSELFLAGNDQDSLNSARLTMSRQSDDANLLGPLHATEYSFGDVAPVNAGFGGSQGLTRGLSFSNTPINQLANNRIVNITGEIQVGWDVELYQNGVLIDQRLGVSDGYYEFNDVPLNYGNNDFELMLYGPQGQIETKSESYLVDGNNVSAREGMYRFSLVELGKSVFDLGQNTEDPTQQGIVASTVLDYGLTDWLALNVGLSTFEPELGDSEQFYTLGANASLGQAGLLSARFLQNDDALRAWSFDYRTRFLDTSYSLSANRSEFFDNETRQQSANDQLNASMTGQLFSGSKLPISYQNKWQRTESNGEINSETVQNSIGISNRLGYISNSLIWQKAIASNPTITINTDLNNEDTVIGSVQYRKGFGRLHTRLFGNYAVQPDSELSAYGGALNYTFTQSLNSELKYFYFTDSDQYQLNLGVNWRKDAFTLSTSAGYNENGSWTAGLTLRFGLGYEPTQQNIFTSGRPIAQSGAVSARVFEDLNMNGIFDVNEPTIENATVKAVQAYRQEKTNESGVAVLSSLYNNVTTDIVVDESTLDGPFMITAIPGVAIKARKGYVETVELPVVKAGEVEGVIYLKGIAGESDAAPYIMLNLVDKKEKIVASTRSEYDGYYLFTNVKPGSYSLKVDENYIDRRGLKTANKKLDFSSNGDVIAGVDFVLRPLDAAKGYVASAGHFDSPNLLKLYYHILRNKLGGQFIQTPFYIKQPNKAGYILGLAYYPGLPVKDAEAQRKAQQACTNLAKSKVYCDVQYHDFKY